MLKTTNESDDGQVHQSLTLNDGTVIKSVLFADHSENPVRYYLKYYYNDTEITREMFEIYKQSLEIK